MFCSLERSRMLISDTTICWCFSIFAFCAVLIKVYLKLRIRLTNSYTCMVGKVVVITGANTGIGLATALDLAKRGAKVILGCRNIQKAEEAVKTIIYETGNQNVCYKILDLASFLSVRRFAKEIYETEEKIDVLINNAGIGGFDDQQTEDGNLIMIQVNYLSHFLLTHLLIDMLKKPTKARIINLSSSVAKLSNLKLENINNLTKYSYFVHNYFARNTLYWKSKLCLIYFTTELAKRLEKTGITINVLHPGSILTGMWDIPKKFERFFKLIGRLYFKTIEEGARTTIFLASSQDVEFTTGKLFENCKEIKMYKCAQIPELSHKLWIKSEQLVRLQEDEKIKHQS